MADIIRQKPCALYKCRYCQYIHHMPIEVDGAVDRESAVNMLSKIVGRSQTVPRPDLGEIPKYFICNCSANAVGVAEFIGIEF